MEREKKALLGLASSANRLTELGFFRNVLAFLQRTPILTLHVGSEKSKPHTSEKYQKEGEHID